MFATDDDLLRVAQDWAEADKRFALATVIETWARRAPVGSHLIIDDGGRFFGSVSGGCVEADVLHEAQEVIATGKARLLEFGVSDETAGKRGFPAAARSRSTSKGSTDAACNSCGAEFRARDAPGRDCGDRS